jgi:hydroxymethylpyrimidine pyrophosphatase-like HAD family hydrolase
MENQNVFSLVRKLENNYVYGTTDISKYVDYSMYETLETIEAYKNSKHISGKKDSQNRDKPFFNIVTAAINIWYRATDIDRKNIRVKATKMSDWMTAFVATQHLQDWMRKADFGTFLNSWGRAQSAYGSSVIKFVEKEGVLHAEVVPWQKLIVDAIDFDANPVIEKLYYTPSQLRKNKSYDQDMVERLINAQEGRETLDGQDKDNLADYIEVYEIHGELPESWLTDRDEDETSYVQQMHVVSYVEEKDGTFKDFALFTGKEKQSPYMITHLIKEEGRSLSIGAVEYLFDAQWMQNHTIKNMKDQLDLASKLIFQTSDSNYLGRNVLTAIEQGDILVHAANQPLTQINNGSHDIQSLQAFSQQWKMLEKEITSTPDALRGTTPVSGTPLGTTELLANQGQSLFELMTENKGLAIERMMRRFIIPHIKKKMDNADELVATLDAHGLKKIDQRYVPLKAAERAKDKFLDQLFADEIPEAPQQLVAQEAQNIQSTLAQFGNTRFFVPSENKDVKWKEVYKDLEWDLEVEVTNEVKDKQSTMQNLSQMLQLSAQDPQRFQLIFDKMAEESGTVSPLELGSLPTPTPQGQASAQPQPQGSVQL